MACWGELSARLKVECRASRQSLKSSTCRASPHYVPVPYYQSHIPNRRIILFFQTFFRFTERKQWRRQFPAFEFKPQRALDVFHFFCRYIECLLSNIHFYKQELHTRPCMNQYVRKLFHINQCSGLADPHVFEPLGSGSVIIFTDPDPSVNKQKNKMPWFLLFCDCSMTC